MPSLQALRDFKSSFFKIGNELKVLAELNQPLDDLPLPDHEPETIPVQDQTADVTGAGPEPAAPTESVPPEETGEPQSEAGDASPPEPDIFADFGDLIGGGGVDTPTPDSSAEIPSQEESDFGSFIDTIPDEIPQTESPVSPVKAEADGGQSFPDYDIESPAPEDLSLEGLPDFPSDESLGLTGEGEPETEPPAPETELPAPDLEGAETGKEDVGELDLSGLDLQDHEIPDESLEDFDMGDLNLEDASDLDSGESPELPDAESLASEPEPATTDSETLPEGAVGEDVSEDFDELPPVEEASAPETAEAVEEDFSLPEELPDFGEEETGDGTAASEPSGDVDIPEPDSDMETAGSETEALSEEPSVSAVPDENFEAEKEDSFGSGLDDFSFPEEDSVSDKDHADFPMGTAIQEDDDIEEINLTTEELEQLLTTLSSYPLNLRIACEELIAEEAVRPDQMSRLMELLINGAPAEETVILVGKILSRTIPIPKGYQKKTGEELEAEKSSFRYIFVHSFLPIFGLFLLGSFVLFGIGMLTWRFIYNPIRADRIYKLGIERIEAGEYGRANERFIEAFNIHKKKSWFYSYARAFTDARQYTLAGEKYQELLYYTASKNKRRIPEKKAVLEYANLETNYIGDFEAADRLIRRNILDFYPRDKDALLALGDNDLAWGEYEPQRLEDAREAFATYIERYGRSDPLLERMLKYFIRTDNLEQVLYLQSYFMSSQKRTISAATLAEMGGYLLDKRLEKVRGVPNEFLDYIDGIREVLMRAMQQDPRLPESYYHMARYFNYYENSAYERTTIARAIDVFEAAKEENPKRIRYHINSLQRYAEILVSGREFFPAEENIVKGINIYEDALFRRLLTPSPEFGRLYADLGDLEYFVKDGDMQTALDYYRLSEQNGWAPPEIQYRMGAAHYQLRQWEPALERFFAAHREMPPNRRILYALGNVSYMRGNYFAAQGYYDRLLEILEDDLTRIPSAITPTDDKNQLDLAERLMVAQNNLGVTLEALTDRTGNSRYRFRAQGLYSDSERAWDVLTRNPTTMIRMRPSPEVSAPGVNPAFLNVQNNLYPVPGYEPLFFLRVDRDMLEPSAWEDLAPPGYRLSEGIHTGR
uniref:Tetratricopeptide repeat protein n=1 Tax=uncultured bacterium contig00101 TaxID=1181568 RepID=A0A806JZ60_9BACT|nr:hypothetical protein [uncultured bacterium contig00101]